MILNTRRACISLRKKGREKAVTCKSEQHENNAEAESRRDFLLEYADTSSLYLLLLQFVIGKRSASISFAATFEWLMCLSIFLALFEKRRRIVSTSDCGWRLIKRQQRRRFSSSHTETDNQTSLLFAGYTYIYTSRVYTNWCFTRRIVIVYTDSISLRLSVKCDIHNYWVCWKSFVFLKVLQTV